MADPAFRQVILALAGVLELIPGMTTTIDRGEDQPFLKSEAPAANIRMMGISFSYRSHSELIHDMTVAIDLFARQRKPLSANAAQAELMADTMATLWSNRTLGGLIEDMIPQAYDGDEQNRAEGGVTTLTYLLRFLTPVSDVTTISNLP